MNEPAPPPADDAHAPGPERLAVGARLRFLLRDSAVYGVAAAVSAAFGLLTFPLLARHFAVADYGVIDLFSVVSGLLVILMVFGQDSAIARFFYEHTDAQARRQLISQSLVLQLAVSIAGVAILWPFAAELSRYASGSDAHALLVKLILVQAPLQVLTGFALNLLKWTFARGPFLLVSIGSVAARALLLVIGVTWFDPSIEDVFIITLVVHGLFSLLGLWATRRWLVLPGSFAYLGVLLPFGVPYGIICAVGAFLPVLERSLVTRILGPDDLGFYAAGAKIAMLISLPVQAFQTAWGPFALAIYRQPDAAVTYQWVLKSFTLVIVLTVLLLSLFAGPVISLLAGNRYAGGEAVVLPLALALGIQAISWITEIGIGISRRSHLELGAQAALLCVSALAMLLLGGVFGLAGVAYGVLLGQVARAVVASALAQSVYPLPWPFARVAVVLGGCGLAGLIATVAWVLEGPATYRGILVAGILVLPPAAFLYLFSPAERRQFQAALRIGQVRPAGP